MNSPLPDLHLIERLPQRCRLEREEVTFLLRHYARHLTLTPTPRRKLWRITPGGYVGVVPTLLRRLILSAKIPLGNLLYLADPETAVDLFADRSTSASGTEVIALLAGHLAYHMQQRAARGLHRAYRQRQQTGSVLLGPIDVPAQMRQQPHRRDQLHSRFDDFTEELPCHLIPRRLAADLLATALLPESIRGQLQQALAGYAHLPDRPFTFTDLEQLRRQSLPVEYESLRHLCLLLAGQRLVDPHSLALGAGLLLSLERLFEQFITRLVQTATATDPQHTALIQPSQSLLGLAADTPPLVYRPDARIDCAGRPTVVLDAKWKRLDAGPVPEDVYQVLAYATLLGARRAVLIYPAGRTRSWDYSVQEQLTLHIRTLRLTATLRHCQRSAEELQREIQQLAVRNS